MARTKSDMKKSSAKKNTTSSIKKTKQKPIKKTKTQSQKNVTKVNTSSKGYGARKLSIPDTSNVSEKKAKKNTFKVITLASFVAFLALVAILYISENEEKVEEVELEDIHVGQLQGNTVEERLGQRYDVSNAVITEIQNVNAVKERYSALLENAEDGHYIVELSDRVLVYDFESDKVVAEFQFSKVQIN